MKKGYKRIRDFVAVCECGHNHVAVTGDNGINSDEERYELLDECCYCDCERFKKKRGEDGSL